MASRTTRPSMTGPVVTVVFLIALLAASAVLPLPVWILPLYAVVSLVSFAVYAIDKSAARGGRRRVPERALLMLGVVGGWPGSVLAQQTLRHKTKKVSFIRAFWFSVVVNVAVLALFGYALAT